MEAIHEETQLVDEHTTESIHRSLGMFALVIMSHGGNGTIAGCDGKDIQLLDIYKRLLSSTSFPAMAGKPKLVILQSCSGSELLRSLIVFSCRVIPNACVYTIFEVMRIVHFWKLVTGAMTAAAAAARKS